MKWNLLYNFIHMNHSRWIEYIYIYIVEETNQDRYEIWNVYFVCVEIYKCDIQSHYILWDVHSVLHSIAKIHWPQSISVRCVITTNHSTNEYFGLHNKWIYVHHWIYFIKLIVHAHAVMNLIIITITIAIIVVILVCRTMCKSD